MERRVVLHSEERMAVVRLIRAVSSRNVDRNRSRIDAMKDTDVDRLPPPIVRRVRQSRARTFNDRAQRKNRGWGKTSK